mgnify:CR=1 FL=1|jgi:phosphatidylglycerol lysyltransferase
MSTGIVTSPFLTDETTIRDQSFGIRTPSNDLLINRRDLSECERGVLEQLAFQYASVPESYDIAVSDGHVLQTPCRQGAMSVLVDGRFWHIAGGLLVPECQKPETIRWLRTLSATQSRTIALYNVSTIDAQRFRNEGFVVNKLGEEPILTLRNVNWSGKPFEWVRRQSNFCIRAGVEISEVRDRKEQQEIGDTLVEIMSEDLSGRTFDKPLRLLEGEFKPHDLQRRRLFIARSSAGQVEAFLACSPIDAGDSWAFETYRKRNDATRGVTAHLFRTAIDLLRAEGVQQVSLCLIPGRNVRQSLVDGGDWRIRTTLSLLFHRLDFIFNAKGQDHFKSRFRPHYVDRYLCVAPNNSARSLWSFLKTTGAINGNHRNLLSQLRRRKPR